jgi:hypothetical protein
MRFHHGLLSVIDNVYEPGITDREIKLNRDKSGTYSFPATLLSDSILTVVLSYEIVSKRCEFQGFDMTDKWYKHAYRRNVIDMHIEDWNDEFLSRFSPEDYVANLKKAHIQSPMIYIQSHVGHCYWPQRQRAHAQRLPRP